MSRRSVADPPAYTVVGYLRGNYGLSVAARNTVQALRASGRTVLELPIDPAGDRGEPSIGARPRATRDGQLNLFEIGPPELLFRSSQWRPGTDLGARNVCIPFWELPRVPLRWCRPLSAMDAVLAPTRFIASACAREIPEDRIIHYPQAVFLPSGIVPSRQKWGLPADATIFVVAFDAGSDIDRKNPWAAIDAFQRAFQAERDVRLVVKMKPWPQVPAFRAQAEAVRARAGSDARVHIIDESLSYDDVLSLYASCDVMVSLHRSEGLGLHLMEAMSLGKVVVATNWSGNVDFMSTANSVPIGFRLVPLATAHPSYATELGRPGQVWAEASVEEAIEALRGLHADPGRRATLGKAAALSMEACGREMLGGRSFDELEARIAGWGRDPARLWAALRSDARADRRRALWSAAVRLPFRVLGAAKRYAGL